MGQEKPPSPPDEPPAAPDETAREMRSIYRHPLAAVGAAMVVAGSFAFVLLMGRDLTATHENPYRSLVTFIGLPAVIAVGVILFLLSIRIQVVQARRREETVRFSLRVEPTNPKYMRNLWLFLGLSAIGVLVVGFVGFKGYETTESTSFCGETCHEVMEPEFVTHQSSPHARVQCVECHIGPGASYFVKSKIDGLRQLWAVAFDTFDRPIEGPFELRPAQETCEECHWPEAFSGRKVTTETYWGLDESNSPWSLVLLLDIGRDSRDADPSGIHWHMLTENVVEYISSDPENEEIPWVRVTRLDGSTAEYAREGAYIPELTDSDVDIHQFDCLDCHSRPSHVFALPSDSINEALTARRIPSDLPHIKREGLKILLAEYPDRETAHESIRDGLVEYYERSDPQVLEYRAGAIDDAANALIEIYDANFFPEMKTDFRARHDNLGHRTSEGCFRCHDGEMADSTGRTITNDCDACHTIIGIGSGSDPELLPTDLDGLEFQHFGTVGDAWQERSCASCHALFDGF